MFISRHRTAVRNQALLFAIILLCAASMGLAGCTALVSSSPSPNTVVPPSITTQPASTTVTAGQTATFTVVVAGTAPLSYQWKKGGTAISGATASSYTTPATTSADNGSQFTVTVSNSAGSVTSNAATLTVTSAAVAPSITTQPTSQTVTAGQTATFTVVATGTAALAYQWKKGGTAISGATSASYTTPATTSADNGSQFTVTVSNSVGSVTSNVATLTVNSSGGTIPNTLGWFQIPNTAFVSVQQTVWPAAGDPAMVMAAWGGGTYDSKRNRLMIWGGGHGDYKGNEVYALDLNANPIVPLRLNNPNQFSPDGTCHSPFQPGSSNPSSRHTYGALAYLPTQDKMLNVGGSEVDSGCFGSDSWTFDPGANSWSLKINNSRTGGSACSYNPMRDVVDCFEIGVGSLFEYNPVANTMTEVTTETATGITPGCDEACPATTIDYDAKRLYVVGRGMFMYYDISGTPPYPQHTLLGTPSGCNTFVNISMAPGLEYDPTLKQLVEWAGGNTVNTYNPATNSCSSITYTGGPPTSPTSSDAGQQANGTYGRFRYASQMRVYVVCNDWAQNCYSLRLTQGTSADQNFQNRCAAPGVLSCQGFDTDATFTSLVSEGARTDGFDMSSHPNITRDTSVFISGGSSANFLIPAGAGENDTGNWWQFFGQGANNQFFGQNSTFYVQYGFRADATWTSTNWTQFGPSGSNTSPKLSIFHNVHAGSCAAEEVTIHNHDGRNLPAIYTDCGSPSATTGADGHTWDGSDSIWQQGWNVAAPFTGYECDYGTGSFTGPNCFHFVPNQWYTIYFKVHVGTWGAPNSSIEAWIAPYGQQLKKFINVLNNFTLYVDTTCDGSATDTGAGSQPCHGYDVLELTQFMTGKIPGTGPAAHVWYDEVIVSSQPIPAPAGQTP